MRPAEQCEAAPSGAVERATSRAALILKAGTVTWVSKAEAVVEVEDFRSAVAEETARGSGSGRLGVPRAGHRRGSCLTKRIRQAGAVNDGCV